jgi:hypothetical protein
LTSKLFNYLNGDQNALQMVRVPSEEQEQLRLASRQHDQLVEERKRLGATGNAMLLSQGFGSWSNWWRPKTWARLNSLVPAWLLERLQIWVDVLKMLDEKICQAKVGLEMVWRMVLFQPQYKPVQKWQEVLRGGNPALKKKAVVAIGRQLIVDLWRLETGRVTAQELNLVMIDAEGV